MPSAYTCIITGFLKMTWLFQACKLKLGDSKGALLDADFALRETEGNAKAFFRQGQVGNFCHILCFADDYMFVTF